MSARPNTPVSVLIVDDSIVFRRFLARCLAQDPEIDVIGQVESAEEASAFLRLRRPDVITLDLEMPGQGGLAFLKESVRRIAVPFVVISGHTTKGAAKTIEALEAGAVEVLAKPRGVAPGTADALVMSDFACRIKAVGRARVRARPQRMQSLHSPALHMAPRAAGQNWLIALGASSGGVQALGQLLPQFPRNAPPIVLVQHMPETFTGHFARRLNGQCQIEVREAMNGDLLEPGLALIAPGGSQHMVLAPAAHGRTRCLLIPGDPVCYSRPSVDVLFHSAAQLYGPRISAAILTGMGSDGADGLLAIRQAGGHTFAQDEATAQIFGMPARAWERGGAREQVPLGDIAQRLLGAIGTAPASADQGPNGHPPLPYMKGPRP